MLLIHLGEITWWHEVIPHSFKETALEKTLNSRPTSIDGYTPKNKKLLQYPYLYLAFTPQNGSNKLYKYEDFENATPKFRFISEINPNPTVEVIPENYKGDGSYSLNDCSILNGYPTISYKNDVFNTWLAQNSEIINLQTEQNAYNLEMNMVKQGMGMLGDIISTASGNLGSTGNIIGGALNIASATKNFEYDVAKQMAQIEAQKLLPDKATLSSSNATLLGYNLISENVFTRYNIKSQFARRIDKYFDMYGYATNELKVPNINNRPYWNYVKTLGCNIEANIPQLDLLTIKNMFDQGVTLWHDTEHFLDYTQNNKES